MTTAPEVLSWKDFPGDPNHAKLILLNCW